MQKRQIKIGIISINDLTNYGNRLQNYALYQILSKYGDVENIPYYYGSYRIDNNSKIYKKRGFLRTTKNILRVCTKKFSKIIFNSKQIQREKRFLSFNKLIKHHSAINQKTNYKILNNQFDYFCVGSDQIWNPVFCPDPFIPMLKFATSTKRIAVAPSIAIHQLTEQQKPYFDEIDNFSKLSVRELNSCKLLKEFTDKPITNLIDPTLMLSKDQWDLVAQKSKIKMPNNKYLFVYLLGGMTKQYQDTINELSNRYGLQVVDILNSQYYTSGPCEFVDLIKNSEAVLTDSFHGSIFAYIYNKPLKIVQRSGNIVNMNSRLEDLTEKLNLKACFVNEKNRFLLEKPEYDTSLLKNEQKKFYKYLDEALKPLEND